MGKQRGPVARSFHKVLLLWALLAVVSANGSLRVALDVTDHGFADTDDSHDRLPSLPRSLATSASSGSQRGQGSPFPSTVSVVILNWKRPANVRKILSKYVEYEVVGEIIVWMCNPETRFEYNHPKVRIIDDVGANERFGLSTRFKGCLKAKSPWVLIQDDDHYAKEKGIRKLMAIKQRFPSRLIGAFGRDWPQGKPPSYIRSPMSPGPCRIILTILMLTDQSACKAFWENAPLVQPYINQHSKPLWNGEDIFFSLVSYKQTKQVPLLARIGKVFMSQNDTGIHFGGGHDTYRDEFLKHAIKQLKINVQEYDQAASRRGNAGRGASGEHGQPERRARLRAHRERTAEPRSMISSSPVGSAFVEDDEESSSWDGDEVDLLVNDVQDGSDEPGDDEEDGEAAEAEAEGQHPRSKKQRHDKASDRAARERDSGSGGRSGSKKVGKDPSSQRDPTDSNALQKLGHQLAHQLEKQLHDKLQLHIQEQLHVLLKDNGVPAKEQQQQQQQQGGGKARKRASRKERAQKKKAWQGSGREADEVEEAAELSAADKATAGLLALLDEDDDMR